MAVERACWCGSSASESIGAFEKPDGGDEWKLVRCGGCGVLALHPQPSDDELAVAYSAEYYGSSRRKFMAPIAAFVGLFQRGRARRVGRAANRGGRILDVGCGNGGFLMQMQRRGYEVEGTEWTAASAKRVPSDSGIPVHVGDLIDIELPAASFDAVTLWHVFEHLRRPRESLEKIRRLLMPGGVLLLSMPNAESGQAQRFGTNWFHHDPPRHIFGFGPHSITLLLEDSGFAIENISTWSLEQNPFGEIQSALNARGQPRDRLYAVLKGSSVVSLGVKVSSLLDAAFLAPLAIARDVYESSRGEGATMTITARLR